MDPTLVKVLSLVWQIVAQTLNLKYLHISANIFKLCKSNKHILNAYLVGNPVSRLENRPVIETPFLTACIFPSNPTMHSFCLFRLRRYFQVSVEIQCYFATCHVHFIWAKFDHILKMVKLWFYAFRCGFLPQMQVLREFNMVIDTKTCPVLLHTFVDWIKQMKRTNQEQQVEEIRCTRMGAE